jgi:hypothetical protein
MATTNGTKKAPAKAPAKTTSRRRQPPSRIAKEAEKAASKREPKTEVQPDSLLIKRYEVAAAKGAEAEGEFLLKLFNDNGQNYKAVRLLIGKPAGWMQRRLDKLTGTHPEAPLGRKRDSNGASKAAQKPAKAAANKASPAKAGTAKRATRATKKAS